MSFSFFGVRVRVNFLWIALLALFSFWDETGVVLLAISTAFLHELGHVIAAQGLGCGVKELYFAPFGIRMILKKPLELVDLKRKIIILSAGCIVNFVLCALFFVFLQKIAAITHLITAVFNLLPAGTLDGGKILLEILYLKLDLSYAERVMDFISLFFSAVLFVIGSFILVYSGYNISLIITSIYLAFAVIIRQKKLN